jgi:hypothetical protein
MRRTKLILAAATALLTSAAHAGGYVSNATVLEVSVHRGYGAVAFVKVSATPVDSPACAAGHYWQFTLTLDGVAAKEMYSLLMTAVATGKQVKISGSGSCTEHSQIESIHVVNILQ